MDALNNEKIKDLQQKPIWRKKDTPRRPDIECVFNQCSNTLFMAHEDLPNIIDCKYLSITYHWENDGWGYDYIDGKKVKIWEPIFTARISYGNMLLFKVSFKTRVDARMSVVFFIENHYITKE